MHANPKQMLIEEPGPLPSLQPAPPGFKLGPALLRFLEPGDVVTIKGSRGARVSRVLELLRAQSARPETCRQET